MLTGYLSTLPTDTLLSAGVLYCEKAGTYVPIGVTDGAPDFDAASDQAEIMFDNRAPSRLKGLTRIVGYQPVIKGTLKEFGASATGSQIPVLEPGETEATVAGVTTVTPRAAGSLFASGEYIVDFRWIFERGGGGYACIYAPLAICRKWAKKGVDKKEAQISFEIECVGDPVNDLGTGPYAIELRTNLPTGAPSTPAQLFAALNAASTSGGVAMDMYIDGSSPVSMVAAVGQASITTVVDGGQPSGRRMTKWESCINPGVGKHWRPSADFNSGLGANSDGLTLRGMGMELPGSVGYSGTGCHAEDTSITATTPGQTGSTLLKDYFQDFSAGLTWVFLCRPKNNSGIVDIGETSADVDHVSIAGDDLWGTQAIQDDPSVLGLNSNTATGVARSRMLVARSQLPTTTQGVMLMSRAHRDLFWAFGGTGSIDGPAPALTGTRRVRLLLNGGFNSGPQCEINLAIPVRGRFNGAQWALLFNTMNTWYPDLYDDTRPNLTYFGGDSFPAAYYGQGQESNVHSLVLGKNSAPAVSNAAVISVPQSGNTPWTYQWPVLRMIAEADLTNRTRVGLLFFEALNGASLPENYFMHDWWRARGSKYKSVLFIETYNGTGITAGQAMASTIRSNGLSHADALLDLQALVEWSTHNYGDGTSGGQNAMLWSGNHPTVSAQEHKQAMYREAIRFLAGGDPSTNTAYGVPTPDNVTLTGGAPTANPSIQAVNWQGTNLGGKTWTHAMVFADGTSATTVATVISDGTITRVAAGHCLRRSISNDGAQCVVDVVCT